MKNLLIDVSYTDNTNRFWFDSCLKNKKIGFDPETQNIHDVIRELCDEQDGMELVYKGKPQGNIFRDVQDKDGVLTVKRVGYLYRGQSEIYDHGMNEPKIGRFDVWVTISEVIPFEIEELD